MPHFDMYKLLSYFHLSGCLDLHVIFARSLSHDARITPSKTNKNISKI